MANFSIKIKQTLIGKLLFKSNLLILLNWLRIFDYEGIKVLALKTFKYKVGDGKWHRLGNEYQIAFNGARNRNR